MVHCPSLRQHTVVFWLSSERADAQEKYGMRCILFEGLSHKVLPPIPVTESGVFIQALPEKFGEYN